MLYLDNPAASDCGPVGETFGVAERQGLFDIHRAPSQRQHAQEGMPPVRSGRQSLASSLRSLPSSQPSREGRRD